MLYFIYNNDELVGFKYNGNTYHYHKNLFGDVIGIYDSNNNEIVTYEYDSWGALISVVDTSSIGLATINPFRYRSYYYDEETKLYYLNSRYYNPAFGRFINADGVLGVEGLESYNLYSYTGNNPVNNIDSKGTSWKKLWSSVKNIAKKVYCQIKKEVKKVVKAVVTQFPTDKDSFSKTFVAEASVGLGFDIAEKVGLFDGTSWKYKNGERVESNKFTLTTDIEIGFITIETGYISEHENNYKTGLGGWYEEVQHRGFVQNPFQVYNCPATQKEFVNVGIEVQGIKLFTISSDKVFIGVDFSKAVVIGGGVKIGLEFDL